MEKIIKTLKSKIWTKRSGQGKIPVILISGCPGVENYMEPVANMLEEQFDVIQFDPSGCGCSTVVDKSYGIEEYIEDLEQIRRVYGIEKW